MANQRLDLVGSIWTKQMLRGSAYLPQSLGDLARICPDRKSRSPKTPEKLTPARMPVIFSEANKNGLRMPRRTGVSAVPALVFQSR